MSRASMQRACSIRRDIVWIGRTPQREPIVRRVLLDACVPVWLARELAGVFAEASRSVSLDIVPDGELLAIIDGRYDVLVAMDRNLTFQQRISDRQLAVVVLRVRRQSRDAFRSLLPDLRMAAATARAGEVVEVRQR